MNVFVKSLLYPIYGLLFLVPCLPHLTGQDFPDHALWFPDITPRNFVFRVMVEVMVALWAVLMCLDARYRPRLRGPVLAMCALVAVAALADVCGRNPAHSIWSNLERMEGLVGHLHLLGFFLVITSVLRSPRQWHWFFLVSLLIAASITVWVFGQRYWGFDLHLVRRDMQFFRADARIGSPVYLTVYMLFHLFLAALFFCRTLRETLRKNTTWRWSTPQLAGYFLMSVAFAWTMYQTATRLALPTAAFGFGIALLVALAYAARHPERYPHVRKPALIALVVLLVAVVVVAVLFWLNPAGLRENPQLRRFLSSVYALKGRTWVWGAGLQGILARPLLGWGQENFSYVFDQHYDPRLRFQNPWYDHPHNVFIGWAVSTGIFGFVAYVSIYFTTLRGLWTKATKVVPLGDRGLLTGLIAAYVFFNCFQLDNLISYLSFLSIVGYIHVASVRDLPARAAVPLRWRWLSVPVAVLGVLGCSATIGHVVREWRVAQHMFYSNVRAVTVIPGKDKWPTIRDTLALAQGSFALPELRENAVMLAFKLRYNNELTDDLKVRFLDLAMQEMNKQVEEDGDRVRVRTLYWAGKMFLEVGRHADAIRHLERAREMSPKRQIVLFELGTALTGAGRHDDAIAVLRIPTQLDEDDEEARIRYVVAVIRGGRLKQAQLLVNELYAESARPDARIVDALVQTGQAALLVPIYTRLVGLPEVAANSGKKVPAWAVIRRYLSLAVAQDMAGQKDEAIATLQTLVSRVPLFHKYAQRMIDTLNKGQALAFRQVNGVYQVRGMRAMQTDFEQRAKQAQAARRAAQQRARRGTAKNRPGKQPKKQKKGGPKQKGNPPGKK